MNLCLWFFFFFFLFKLFGFVTLFLQVVSLVTLYVGDSLSYII